MSYSLGVITQSNPELAFKTRHGVRLRKTPFRRLAIKEQTPWPHETPYEIIIDPVRNRPYYEIVNKPIRHENFHKQLLFFIGNLESMK